MFGDRSPIVAVIVVRAPQAELNQGCDRALQEAAFSRALRAEGIRIAMIEPDDESVYGVTERLLSALHEVKIRTIVRLDIRLRFPRLAPNVLVLTIGDASLATLQRYFSLNQSTWNQSDRSRTLIQLDCSRNWKELDTVPVRSCRGVVTYSNDAIKKRRFGTLQVGCGLVSIADHPSLVGRDYVHHPWLFKELELTPGETLSWFECDGLMVAPERRSLLKYANTLVENNIDGWYLWWQFLFAQGSDLEILQSMSSPSPEGV